MNQPKASDWLSMVVATALPLLATFASPWVSMPITLATLLLMSVHYRRTSNSRVGPAVSLLGAAVVAVAMVYLWMRSPR